MTHNAFSTEAFCGCILSSSVAVPVPERLGLLAGRSDVLFLLHPRLLLPPRWLVAQLLGLTNSGEGVFDREQARQLVSPAC